MINLHTTEAVKRIRKLSIDQLYNKILDWLSKEKARIKRQNRPHYILAEHGSSLTLRPQLGYERNAKKTIRISLYPNADYTVLHIAMDQKWYYKFQNYGAWSDLIGELLADLSVEKERASLLDLEGSAILRDDRTYAFKLTIIGALLLTIGIASTCIWVYSGIDIQISIAFICILWGIILFATGYERRKISKGIRHPNATNIIW